MTNPLPRTYVVDNVKRVQSCAGWTADDARAATRLAVRIPDELVNGAIGPVRLFIQGGQ